MDPVRVFAAIYNYRASLTAIMTKLQRQFGVQCKVYVGDNKAAFKKIFVCISLLSVDLVGGKQTRCYIDTWKEFIALATSSMTRLSTVMESGDPIAVVKDC